MIMKTLRPGVRRNRGVHLRVSNVVAEVVDALVMRLYCFAEKVVQNGPFRLTGCPESEKLSATVGTEPSWGE
ncbi:MAG: hypothetical protein CL534_23475 [Ahrensia sp.]|nr:hypothetical protein [Ahrensia sp.]